MIAEYGLFPNWTVLWLPNNMCFPDLMRFFCSRILFPRLGCVLVLLQVWFLPELDGFVIAEYGLFPNWTVLWLPNNMCFPDLMRFFCSRILFPRLGCVLVLLQVWFLPELDGFVIEEEYGLFPNWTVLWLPDNMCFPDLMRFFCSRILFPRLGCVLVLLQIWFVPELDGFVIE